MSSQQLIYDGLSALVGILAAVLLAKKMWAKFPIFTAFALVNFFEGVALAYWVRHGASGMMATYTYWLSEVLVMLLELGVAYEIFRNLFASYDALRRLASNILYWVLVALVVLGCVILYTHAAVQGNRFVAAFIVVEEAIRIIEVGLILLLFLFSGTFGLHWRQSVFGIALGLGALTTVDLLSAALRAHFGTAVLPTLGIVRTCSFAFSLLVWLGYLLVPERLSSPTTVPERGQLEQWNQALRELNYQ